MWPISQFPVALVTFTGKILNGKLHFLYSGPQTYIPSSSTASLLTHLQYYQRCEPMILTIWLKSKLFLWQPRYNLLTEKKDKKTYVFWSTHFFKNVLLLSIPRNYLQTWFLDYILLGNFTLPKSIISAKDLIRWKKGFEKFLIEHHAGGIGNKNITAKYLKILASVSFTQYWVISSSAADVSIIPWFK